MEAGLPIVMRDPETRFYQLDPLLRAELVQLVVPKPPPCSPQLLQQQWDNRTQSYEWCEFCGYGMWLGRLEPSSWLYPLAEFPNRCTRCLNADSYGHLFA